MHSQETSDSFDDVWLMQTNSALVSKGEQQMGHAVVERRFHWLYEPQRHNFAKISAVIDYLKLTPNRFFLIVLV